MMISTHWRINIFIYLCQVEVTAMPDFARCLAPKVDGDAKYAIIVVGNECRLVEHCFAIIMQKPLFLL